MPQDKYNVNHIKTNKNAIGITITLSYKYIVCSNQRWAYTASYEVAT